MSNSPLSPRSQSRPVSQPEDEDEEMLGVDQEEREEQEAPRASDPFSQSTTQQDPRPARENRKDKDLKTFLNSMDKYAPIVITL
jgi:hypothetical protein